MCIAKGKVYCIDCKRQKSNIQPWQDADLDDLCKRKFGIEDNSVDRYEYYLTCAEANPANSCELFEPRFWSKLKRFFCKRR